MPRGGAGAVAGLIGMAHGERTRGMKGLVGAAIVAFVALALPAGAAEVYRGHGMAMHGDAKYPPGFKHFDYVNPKAPKGGAIKLGALQTFDSFNPYIIKGVGAAGLGLTADTLMVNSADEALTIYGLIAESIETPKDRSWVIFNLRPEARFHDGSPITADDVIFSFNILIEKGRPFYRAFYGNVAKVEKLGRHRVKFSFKPGENRELPLILGGLTVMSKAYWQERDFSKTTLKPPLGSGPYKLEAFEAGRSVTYRRVKDYWAKDLPVNVGRYNFDQIRYEYYRDPTILREALKAGDLDHRGENQSKAWATAYDIAAVRDGLLVKKNFPHQQSAGMQAFVFNMRRPMFQDRRVRQALMQVFDFEWTNRNLFYGQYTRTSSYFSNSELASSGLPKGEELEILERFRGRIPDEVFTREFKLPVFDGSGSVRSGMREALRLLKQAGWRVRDKKLVDPRGEILEFEFLLISPEFERVILPYVRNLDKLGIKVHVRLVDPSQYVNRMNAFDFDMVVTGWGQSLSPGNEQRIFWSSKTVDTPGSRNLAGIKDPAIDELVELVIAAPDRASLVQRTRALDRVLLWGQYVVPNWHIPYDRLIYWDKFGIPKKIPVQGTSLMTWWIDSAKAKALAAKKSKTGRAETGKMN
jgi:microcin C transport system substrate-binding protein